MHSHRLSLCTSTAQIQGRVLVYQLWVWR